MQRLYDLRKAKQVCPATATSSTRHDTALGFLLERKSRSEALSIMELAERHNRTRPLYIRPRNDARNHGLKHSCSDCTICATRNRPAPLPPVSSALLALPIRCNVPSRAAEVVAHVVVGKSNVTRTSRPALDAVGVTYSAKASSTEKSASETPHSTLLPSIEAHYVQFLVQKLHIGVAGDGSGFSWLARGIDSTDSDSMEYISSRCLAQAFFGRYHQLPAVVEDARHAYTRTLRMVREKMEARESLHQTPLMLTIITLAVFETVTRTSSSAWSMHTQGLAQIIQIRGPKAFRQSPTLAMFEVGRGFIVIEGIVNKHKIFLEDDQWLPRQSTVRTRSTKSQLFDILCALPSLVADVDLYKTAGRPVDDGLRSRIVRILNGLFEWRWKWERTYGGCAFEVMTDCNIGLNLDENGQPFHPTVLYFSDQLLATDIAHYDAAVAFVLRIAQETLGESWSSFVDVGGPSDLAQPTSPLCLPPRLRSASDAMTELFRLVEFHLSGGEDVSADAYRLLFPFSLAGKGLFQESSEARRIRQIRRELADVSGFGSFDLSPLPEDWM